MSWLTHLTQIFGISDLIIILASLVVIGMGLWHAFLYSRQTQEMPLDGEHQSMKQMKR